MSVYKELHSRIEYEMYKEIESRAKKKGVTINKEINDLISYSLDIESVLSKFDLIFKLINKEYSNSRYIKKLLEQLYADIITDPSDVKDSEALQKFKENIKGDKLIE